MAYNIGVLDQNQKSGQETDRQTLLRSVELAKKAEQWGYSRYWTAEHHNSIEIVGPAPEILLAFLINQTNTIRLGSGGVMLQHYSPYKVAEVFQVLEALAPNRIDLGVGKGPGGLPLSTKALQYGTQNDGKDFEKRLTLLQQLVNNSLPETHELYGIQVTPRTSTKQQINLLGSSQSSAKLAKKAGLPYTFAHFYSSEEELALASSDYNKNNPNKLFILAVAVFAADTTSEALELASREEVYKVLIEDGRSITVVSEAAGHLFGRETGLDYVLKKIKMNYIAGTSHEIKNQLDQIKEKYNVDEFIFHTPIKDAVKRLRSFELLSPNRLLQQV